jgi:hypothetical protein
MMGTKKELIEMYNKGELKDNAIYNPSAFDAYVLCEWDDEQAFGYYQYMDQDKDFFKVKMNILNDDTSIRVHGKTLKGSNFLRTR